MLKAFHDPTYQHFSAFFLGLAGSIVGYLIFALIVMIEQSVSNWLWFFGIPLLVIGLLVDLLSRRLWWIRLYQSILFLLCTLLIMSYLLIAFAKNPQINIYGMGFTLAVIACAVAGFSFRQTLQSPLRRTMPHGALGRLDPKTGAVYPEQSPPAVKTEWEETKRGLNALSKLTPLIAGAAMVLVQVIATPQVLSFINFLLSLGVTFCASGIGSYAAFAYCVRQWETEHQKKILVKY